MDRPIMIISMVEDVKGRGGSGYVVKKIVRFLKSGCLIISIGFSMGISGCKGNTEEPVSSEPIEIVSEKGMDDNFINIPIDIYAEATTKIS